MTCFHFGPPARVGASVRRVLGIAGALAILAATLASGTRLAAASPEVTHHRPLGVVRGEETTVVFYGNRLGDAHAVLCDQPGIEILEVKPLDEKSVEVKLKANETTSPGIYPVRVITASGIANLRLVGVGVMPVVQEQEPNNSFDQPQAIEMDRTIEGVVDREDVDCFRVTLAAGQKLTVEMEGIRHAYDIRNRFILDPYVAILNSKRFEVTVSDDSSLLRQDGVCSFTPEEAGEYTILVRESSFRGRQDVCGYRLHVGSFPRPVTVLPSGGGTGEVMEAKLIDIDGSITEASVQLPSEPVAQWPVVTETDKGISPSPNWIRVSEAPIVIEQEPNNDNRKAPTCEVPALLCGVVQEPGDYDCFSFACKKGENFRVQLYARQTLRSPLDGVIHVFDPDHKTLKGSDDVGGNPDGSIDFTAAADGTHTVRVYDHLQSGSPQHNYVIEVSRLEPSIGLELKELDRDLAMSVPVPAGGYGAMVVQAKRERFNEEIALELEGLPEGVTAVTFPVPEGRVETPVLLRADAGLAPAGALFEIRGTGKAGDTELRGELSQHHKLVLGQNRREMWGFDTDRAALAICEPAPFNIELVQPKTPILRRGSKELQVKVERHEGFDGVVSLRTLYNPPGVGVNNSRRLEKDKTEVTVPITANGSAATGDWPMVLLASFPTSRGTATVATAPIMLQVEEPVFNYTFPRTAAELGTESSLTLGVEKIRDIEGEIELTLVGLPNGVTSPEPTQKVTLDATTVTFPLTIDAEAKTGVHKTLVVQTQVSRDGEVMLQTDGTGELRIDKPLPPKSDAEPKPKEEPKPEAAPKKTPPKPLSRLEQLRQQKEAS